MPGYQRPTNQLLKQTIAPVNTPVSLVEAKEHLQILDDDSDITITSLIEVATAYFDGPNGVLSKALISQTWALSLPCAENNQIEIPLTPAQTIASISYFDTEGNVQNLL